MSWAIVKSRSALGVHALPINVEIHLSPGLPGFHIVGLPEKAVRESKERVRSALLSCAFRIPAKRIVINLSPASFPKEGAHFDLPISVGILIASAQLPKKCLESIEMVGELELSGKLGSVKNILPFAIATQKAGHCLIFPKENIQTIALLPKLRAYSAEHLLEVCRHLQEIKKLPLVNIRKTTGLSQRCQDLSAVRGQDFAKRALEVAAAGAHSLLLSGPPGAGKTLLASCLPGILPSLQEQESLEVAAIYSVHHSGFRTELWGVRPFRSPHHTASARALVGGGNPPQPGEISLAHHGVLFLDELPEFPRQALEALREPIEAGRVTISRAAHQVEFPASFQLIAAMNPCPCGYATVKEGACRCTSEQIYKYQLRISGPLLDRIDMDVNVLPVSSELLLDRKISSSESNQQVVQRVSKARQLQLERSGQLNAQLSSDQIIAHCHWNVKDRAFFTRAAAHLGLSARAYYRILKLARTVADISESNRVLQVHLEEALCFRNRISNHLG